ncbi:MAG: DMT family transporter [Vicingaceae bacterium]|nr:DMT family transporter [Vicingaceae bacterium]
MSKLNLDNKVLQWLTLFLLAFIWGSSFILMKKGLEVYSHTLVAALRISIAFLFLLPFAFKQINKIEKKYWKYLIATGILGNGIPAFLFTLAQTEISSSLSGMLNSLVPIFALLVGAILFKQRVKKFQLIGVSIGLIGAVGLIATNGLNLENSNSSYSFLILLATICYALSVNIIKVYLKEIKAIAITSLAFLSIGPLAILYILNTDFVEITKTSAQATNALIYIGLLAIFGTAISVILFNLLIKKTTALFASSVTYLIPVFAIMWGVLAGEILTVFHLASISIILLGIYFINKIG